MCSDILFVYKVFRERVAKQTEIDAQTFIGLSNLLIDFDSKQNTWDTPLNNFMAKIRDNCLCERIENGYKFVCYFTWNIEDTIK